MKKHLSGGSGGDSSGGKGGSASGGSGGKASGGGGGSSASGGGAAIAIEQYPMALATGQCEQLTKCCMNSDAMCVVKKRSIYLAGVNNLKKGITAGRLEYDGQKLSGCLAKLAALACDAKQADVDAATKDCVYLKGSAANGTECFTAAECKEGYCDKTEPTKTTSECIARKDIDAVCKGNDQCKSGNCKLATMMATEGKCAAAEAPKPGLCAALPPN